MNCFFATHQLSAFLDETLAPEKRRDLEEHLQACPSCARQLTDLRATLDRLHRTPLLNAEVGVRSRLRFRLAQRQLSRPWRERFILSPGSLLTVSVGTLLLMAFGYGIGGISRVPSKVPPPRSDGRPPAESAPVVIAPTATPSPMPTPIPMPQSVRPLPDQGTFGTPTPRRLQRPAPDLGTEPKRPAAVHTPAEAQTPDE